MTVHRLQPPRVPAGWSPQAGVQEGSLTGSASLLAAITEPAAPQAAEAAPQPAAHDQEGANAAKGAAQPRNARGAGAKEWRSTAAPGAEQLAVDVPMRSTVQANAIAGAPRQACVAGAAAAARSSGRAQRAQRRAALQGDAAIARDAGHRADAGAQGVGEQAAKAVRPYEAGHGSGAADAQQRDGAAASDGGVLDGASGGAHADAEAVVEPQSAQIKQYATRCSHVVFHCNLLPFQHKVRAL